MSLMDLMREDFSTQYGTRQRTLLRPFHFKQLANTKLSLLTSAITQGTMYNSSYGQILRHFMVTVGSSSPVTTKTKSSNHFTPDVPLSSLVLSPRTDQKLQQSSLKGSKRSWIKNKLSQMIRFSFN